MLLRLMAFRAAAVLPQLFLVSLAVFFLSFMLPGSPAAVLLGPRATSEAIATLEHRLGVDRPVLNQFADWFAGAARGDLGTSWFGERPVSQLIADHMAPTLSLTFGGITVAVLLGMSLGILAALRPGSLTDRLVGVLSAGGLSIPAFWLGLILLSLFAVRLGWLPVLSWSPPSRGLVDWAQGMVLPSIALGVAGAAVIARHTRSSMIEALDAPYVRTLRAMGTPRRTIVTRYALKNAMIPILSVVAFQLSTLLAAGFVVEKVFTIPGMGTVLIDAVARKDIPVVQGVTLVVALFVIGVYFVTDLGYALLNPRARPQ